MHPVTQTVGALLGIIVFPWHKAAFSAVKKKRLAITTSEGWPSWQMSGSAKVTNVGHLIELLRHAVAHAHVSFDSDSKVPHEVTITFKNYPQGSRVPNWTATIRADQLVLFCRKFCEFVADYVS